MNDKAGLLVPGNDIDIGAMLQSQFAIMYPLSKTGIRLHKQSLFMNGNHYLSVGASQCVF